MAYVINKATKDAQGQRDNAIKQGSAVVGNSGINETANRQTSFVNPSEVIRANQGNQNEAVGSRIRSIINTNKDTQKQANVAGALGSQDAINAQPKSYEDLIKYSDTELNNPNLAMIKTPTFNFTSDTQSKFGNQLSPGFQQDLTSIVAPQGGRYTQGMSNLDNILSGRSGTLGQAMTEENKAQDEIWQPRMELIRSLGGDYTQRPTDYTGTVNKLAADKVASANKTTADRIKEIINQREIAKKAADDKNVDDITKPITPSDPTQPTVDATKSNINTLPTNRPTNPTVVPSSVYPETPQPFPSGKIETKPVVKQSTAPNKTIAASSSNIPAPIRKTEDTTKDLGKNVSKKVANTINKILSGRWF